MYKILFLFVILISSFDYRIAGLNYWDEALIVVGPLYYILATKRICIKRKQLKIWLTLIVVIAIGLFSNALHPEFQSKSIAIVKDIIAIVKFPLLTTVMLNTRMLVKQNSITHEAAMVSKILLYIMFCVALIGYFVNIGVYQDEVRFVRCYKFFFSHPTFLVSSIIMMIAVLLADGIRRNRRELLIAGVLIFLSGRTKGYIMIAILLLVVVIKPAVIKNAFANLSGRVKLKKSYLIFGGVCVSLIVYVLGKNKVIDYMGWGLTAARPALYTVGLYLLKDCFPLGSGFGTFASSISGEYYSSVYSKYHISGVNGLIQGHTNYIADTFPPYIYGQFGIAGAITYILLLLQLIKYQFKRIRSYDKVIGFLFLWIYIFVACSAESFLTNASGAQAAVVLAVYIGFDSDRTPEANIQYTRRPATKSQP